MNHGTSSTPQTMLWRRLSMEENTIGVLNTTREECGHSTKNVTAESKPSVVKNYDPVGHRQKVAEIKAGLSQTPASADNKNTSQSAATKAPNFQLSDNLQKVLTSMSTSDTPNTGAAFLAAYD